MLVQFLRLFQKVCLKVSGIETFVQTFLLNMNFISSEKVRRLNAFAILVLLNNLPANLSTHYFEQFMRHVVFEVKSEKFRVSNQNNGKIHDFRDIESFSKRKGALREKQLYHDIQLDTFFKTQISVV